MSHNDDTNKQGQDVFQPDPTLWFPPDTALQCSEEWNPKAEMDEHGSLVLFHCHILTPSGRRRCTFGMRQASTGVLLPPSSSSSSSSQQQQQQQQQQESSTVPQGPIVGAVDPFFFQADYSLYAATGFSLWPGARLLVEALMDDVTWHPRHHDHHDRHHDHDHHHQQQQQLQQQLQQQHDTSSSTSRRLGMVRAKIPHQARILELGSGTGMVGTCLALGMVAPSHVCLTDLPTLVQHGLQPNLERNGLVFVGGVFFEGPTNDNNNDNNINDKVSTAVLDWTQPVPETIARQTWDLIVASDCFLLQRLYQNVLDTVDALLSPTTQFLFTFQRRGVNQQYTTLEQLLDAITNQRGWTCNCIAWRTVSLGRDGEDMDSRNDLYLFCVTRR